MNLPRLLAACAALAYLATVPVPAGAVDITGVGVATTTCPLSTFNNAGTGSAIAITSLGAVCVSGTLTTTVTFPTTSGTPCATATTAGCSIPDTVALLAQIAANPITPGCTKVVNVSQTSTTDVHTFTGVGHICSVVLISATAQNIGLDEGTGTTCETTGTALIGVSSTASATPKIAVAANGGFSAVSGIQWLTMQASADHLCVLQDGGGQVSGTITYSDP